MSDTVETVDDGIKVQAWPPAYEQWLAGGWRSHGAAISEQTRRAYQRAVDEFSRFVGDQYPLWRVQGSQVVGWQAAMRSRGLSKATINLRLAGLSSLFDFLVCQFPALMDHNPAASAPRARIAPRNPRGLAQDEVTALLRRINRSSVRGLQDYALVMALLSTGRLSKEVAGLTWGECKALPQPAGEAIRAYLQADGRMAAMGDEDYVFVALSDVAGRLPNVKRLDRAKPLSGTMISRIVKKCARRAGLDESRINTHTLRYTTAQTYVTERDEREPLWKNVGAFFSRV